MTASFTPIFAISTPIHSIQSFIRAELEPHTVKASPSNKNIVVYFHFLESMVLDIQSNILNFTKQEAQSLLLSIKKDHDYFSFIEKNLQNIKSKNVQEAEIEASIDSLWLNVKQVILDLEIIAKAAEIDENDPKFVQYWSETVMEAVAEPSNKRVFGKQNLQALFID